ncbi:uncharacterized protein LOC121248969 [Juglans microcarpa x Juglans regia]|uniref:uncharacterized protein LOC121248969 n=1 Tax=Juglans microcarpa x Juglans regia TaxID=2249226 RepID=UPI001B7ED67E|nr:uncharacterized protein LOC121248969 [Juglans microcarpa x Juglans regia]
MVSEVLHAFIYSHAIYSIPILPKAALLFASFLSPQTIPSSMSMLYLPAKPQVPRRKTRFRKRCFLMAKQQKTRFYILGRCISMLLCWHDHDLSD